MVDTTFYFIKYEIDGTLTSLADFDPSQDHDDLVRDAFIDYISAKESVVEGSEGKWYFGDYEVESDRIYGEFGKVYSEEPDIYDEEKGVFVESTTPNTEADYSLFLLHLEKNILIYNTRNRIGKNQFINKFREGFRRSVSDAAEMKTEFIQNTDSVERVVEETTVKEAEFDLVPSNPENEDEWEDLDERIKDMLATRLDLDAESAQGLNFDEELLRQALEMSKSSYGEFYLKYDENGTVRVLDSEGLPLSKAEERPDSIGGMRAKAGDLLAYVSPFTDDG